MSENKDSYMETATDIAETAISTVQAVSKGSGIDALREGDKSIPARILAAGKQFLMPTLSAYLRVENGQPGATPKERMQSDLKAAGACLVDIGTYALATHMAQQGDPQGAFMAKFWFGNVLGTMASEHVFKALAPHSASSAGPTGGTPAVSK